MPSAGGDVGIDEPPTGNLAVVALVVAAVAYFFVAGVSFAVLPDLVADRVGGSDAEVGLAFGTFGVGMLLVRPFTGYLADRFGRRASMFWGAVAVAVLQVLHLPAAEAGLGALLIVRLLAGFAASAMYVSQATVATELSQGASRDRVFATFSASVYVGFMLGPILGQVALDASGFAAAFRVAAGAGVVAAAAVAFIPETRPADADPAFAGLRRLLHPVAARVGVVNLLAFSAFMGFNGFIKRYAESLGSTRATLILATFSFTALAVRVLGGGLLARADRLRLASSAFATVVLGAVILAVSPGEVALFIGAVVLALGIAYIVPLLVLVASDSAPPADRSRVVSTVVTFGDLANSFAIFALGLVADAAGYHALYLAAAAGAAAALLLLRSPFMDPVSGLRRTPSGSTGR